MAPESDQQEVADEPNGRRRERPWLLPYNRRLRNLNGITLRNVTLHPKSVKRSRRKTIDDDALPYALKTPGKIVLHRDSRGWDKGVERSRSSSDLKAAAKDSFRETQTVKENGLLEQEPVVQDSGLVNGTHELGKNRSKEGGNVPEDRHGSVPNGLPHTPQTSAKARSSSQDQDMAPLRKTSSKLRRRSTIEQWYENAPARQNRWFEAVHSHLLDVFFSLHISDDPEPVYVSEIVKDTMNPNFRHFDLSNCAPSISRKDGIVVKVWTKGYGGSSFRHLVELTADLRALQFIGRDLAHFHHPFPDNCVIFHLSDGIYTSFTDIPMSETFQSFAPGPWGRPGDSRPPEPVSSYDQLMRLGTLDQCLQDMLNSRARFKSRLDEFLVETRPETEAVTLLPSAKQHAAEVEKAIDQQTKRNAARKKQTIELQDSLSSRRQLMAAGRAAMDKSLSEMEAAEPETIAVTNATSGVQIETQAHRRRVCTDLEVIYPIEPTPGKSLSFTIRGLALPDAHEAVDMAESDSEREKLGAALGFVAQMLKMLAAYMGWPLPYPIEPQGSTSWIEDPISVMPGDAGSSATASATSASASSGSKKNRRYPLFVKGVPKFRAEYAFFLLNKDIEILAQHMGLRLLDIRQTLPNLKYILFVATAGEGELPERKKGGVRGLGTALKASSAVSGGGRSRIAGTKR
ncbi:hypothetical protein P152DRAFT_181181 [Eremomyces bilateralis CBS 781.70]|uniref:Autophagy-related protein 14 n=1 Tax=Eremomyces bilateralis CBS 781.70 TaxID=1392243 RepID=A0A6G1GB32_9PEZI|nr:uncharacterized protein P152DRAFT_181181 [Eremomyces bilateralis CBS 781.70]KAF1815298.1 hypothetical protein P152DRAFT_181181 [Eremomyces bilateralis CBS 781.70]